MKTLFVTSIMLLLFVFKSMAQGSGTIEMADNLRSSGKIYVVVAVISVIFIGLALYLFSIDRRIKKLEQK